MYELIVTDAVGEQMFLFATVAEMLTFKRAKEILPRTTSTHRFKPGWGHLPDGPCITVAWEADHPQGGTVIHSLVWDRQTDEQARQKACFAAYQDRKAKANGKPFGVYCFVMGHPDHNQAAKDFLRAGIPGWEPPF